MNRPYRLACLMSHPTQYHAPLFRRLAADPALDFEALFLSRISVKEYYDPGFGVRLKWDVPLLTGYRHKFLGADGEAGGRSFWRPWVAGLRGLIAAGRYDAIWLHGYAHQALLRTIAAARPLGMKLLLSGDSHLEGRAASAARRAAKRVAMPRLFAMIGGFLATGTLNRRYYEHYGVPGERIFAMPYAVDNAFFQAAAKAAAARREEFRASLGLQPERPVILYASKLQAHKRPDDLLEAFARMSPDGVREPHAYLLFAGDGERRPALAARGAALGWNAVKFLGFKNQTELPPLYDLCDVFVLPSAREPWGMVINEAMNAGRPVVASDRVGAAADLIADGVNGFVYPAGDIEALRERLRRVIGNPSRAAEMGAASLARINQWDYEAARRGLLQALASIAPLSAADAPADAADTGMAALDSPLLDARRG
jgi:glycosyltransferase involved in cell wall biosynthesis